MCCSLALDARRHPHQLVAMYQQLPQIALDHRAPPKFSDPMPDDMDDPPEETEKSEEEWEREIAELHKKIAEIQASIGAVSGEQDGRAAEQGAWLRRAAGPAESAIASLDRSELERGFFDRFPPLPPTRKQHGEPDLSGPPQEWVELERMRRSGIFTDEHGDHPLERDRRPEDELTDAELDMHTVRAAEAIRFMYPERYEAALDAEKYKTFFQRFPGEALMRDGIKGPRCRFIRADGSKCGLLAVKNQRMCYFHSRTEGTCKRKSKANSNRGRSDADAESAGTGRRSRDPDGGDGCLPATCPRAFGHEARVAIALWAAGGVGGGAPNGAKKGDY